MKKHLTFLSLIFVLSLPFGIAIAVEPDEILDDPVLEGRARDISQDLRCLVCQNQSIDDSNADLAKDLRVIVRERLVAGDSNAQVKAYLVERYGNYVLLKPPVNLQTVLLWVGPLIILIFAIFAVFLWYRKRAKQFGSLNAIDPKTQKLSAEEQARFDALMKDE